MREVEKHNISMVRTVRTKKLSASRLLTIVLTLLGMLGLMAPAQGLAANWETVKTFAPLVQPPPNPAQWPEDVQLGGVGGMAINESGAGGVAPGTIYTVGLSAGEWHAARYSSEGNFELAWTKVARCGPALAPPTVCPAYPTGSTNGIDIAVDQATGNLFVFFSTETPKLVREYNPDGTGPIAEFGELDPTGTITSSPEKIHGTSLAENIAVGAENTVYVFDEDNGTDFRHRLMTFKPCVPGVVTSYCYAGQASDIGTGAGSAVGPTRPVVSKSGRVFASGGTYVLEYDPAHPANPTCTFSLPGGGITSATVDPSTGSIFYYAVKPERAIHQLAPCNAEGKFVEDKSADPPFAAEPQRGNIEAMIFNPTLKFGVAEGTGDLTSGSTEVVDVKITSGVFSVGQAIEGIGIAPNTTITKVATGTIELSTGATATAVDNPLVGVSAGASRKRAAGVLYAGAPQECPLVGQCPTDAQGQSSLGYMFAPQIRLEPVVLSQSATNVGDTSATLNARIEPQGSQTTYVFQYLPEATYLQNPQTTPATQFSGAAEAPLGGAPLEASKLAAVTISGLSPGTSYKYRVIATNANGKAEGTAQAFRTFAVGQEGLPDGRAFELVSPADKNGGEVLPGAPNLASCGSECKPGLAAHRFPVDVRPDGEAVGYQGQPFALNDGSPEYDEYVSRRSSTGWETDRLSPPLVGDASGLLFEAFAFDSNLSHALTYATNGALTPEAPSGYRNLFTESVGNRFGLDPVLTQTPPHRTNSELGQFQLNFAGASSDLSRIFFEANDSLTGATPVAPAAIAGTVREFNLYEWRAGELHLVNVQPGNSGTQPGASIGSGFQLADGSKEVANYSNAISSDGSRVFWSSSSGQVYVRLDGEQTQEIPDHAGKFISASADGSKVLLNDGRIYDVDTGVIADITARHGGFLGAAGQSSDLSSVYFVDSAVLTPSPNSLGDAAQSTKDNLYLWRNGAISFVATLVSSDDEALGVWHASAVQRPAESSPNGRWFAFNSFAPVTKANTVGACLFDPTVQKYVGSAPCQEVYLYDAESGTLTCPSCNNSGTSPLGGSFLRTLRNAQGNLQQPRYLTDQGRLYFDSRDSLVAADTNKGVEDVYQYEPVGVGSCVTESGCVSLLSAGRSSYDSNFLAADTSGNNVFFTTRDRLVPIDRDSLIDLYDARVGGGIAADYASPPAECSGEGCQPSQPAIPGEASPASSSVEGNGDVKPEKKQKHHKKKKHHQRSKSAKQAKHGQGRAK